MNRVKVKTCSTCPFLSYEHLICRAASPCGDAIVLRLDYRDINLRRPERCPLDRGGVLVEGA